MVDAPKWRSNNVMVKPDQGSPQLQWEFSREATQEEVQIFPAVLAALTLERDRLIRPVDSRLPIPSNTQPTLRFRYASKAVDGANAVTAMIDELYGPSGKARQIMKGKEYKTLVSREEIDEGNSQQVIQREVEEVNLLVAEDALRRHLRAARKS